MRIPPETKALTVVHQERDLLRRADGEAYQGPTKMAVLDGWESISLSIALQTADIAMLVRWKENLYRGTRTASFRCRGQ